MTRVQVEIGTVTMTLEKQEISLTFKEEVVLSFLHAQWCNEEAVEHYGSATCEAAFEMLLAWLATPPGFTTLRLNTRLHPDALGTLQIQLQQQYKSRGHEPPKCELHSQIEDLVIIPNSGPQKHPMEEKEVVVGLACGMAVQRGADVYAQGIVAAPSHLIAGDPVSVLADVDGAVCKGLAKRFTGKQLFVGNGVAQMGRTQLFCSGDKPTNKPRVTVDNIGRVGPYCKPEVGQAWITTGPVNGLAIRMTKPLYVAPSLAGLLPSAVFPQNLPSALCSHVLSPQPGEHILDMCAAPGGKTTHIATLMNDKGRVVALDKSKGKIKTIQTNAASWGLTSILAFHFDGTKALDLAAELPIDVLPGCPPFPPETFDRVLLDAPCSTLGQRPAVFNQMKLPEVTSYSPLQRKLFTTAVGLLRTGGVLVYSTCTWTMEENEGLVAWALKTFPEITLAPQTPHIGAPGRLGRGLSPPQLELLQRFGPVASSGMPSPDMDTIGFFCAKFVKAKTGRKEQS